jgi:hypothetical protein
LLQPITLGNAFSFQLESTDLFDPADPFPDSFSFFILDEFGAATLFATTDSYGADALFAVDLTGTGSGAVSSYTAPNGEASWTVRSVNVPEPGGLPLLLAGIGAAYAARKIYDRLGNSFSLPDGADGNGAGRGLQSA